MAKIPIACSLAPDDAAGRVGEWSEFVEAHVVETVRSATDARLRLRDEDATILTAIDLARREKRCCAFFEFQLTIQNDEIWLVIEIPDDSGLTMDDLSPFIAR